MPSGACSAYVVSTGYVLAATSGNGLLNGDTRMVECAPGYTTDTTAGDGTVTCNTDTWTGPALLCTGTLRFALVNIENVDIYNIKLHFN
jgi:hypothetical protein